MRYLLILYNPYYQKDVIDQHLSVLLDQESSQSAQVVFGKIRSKLRDYEHPFAQSLNAIYNSVNEENYLQLFLTDSISGDDFTRSFINSSNQLSFGT